jgi:hypothetical protein
MLPIPSKVSKSNEEVLQIFLTEHYQLARMICIFLLKALPVCVRDLIRFYLSTVVHCYKN